MGFLSPWFLAGAAAVALPVWLHLLRRFKRTPQPFSSLMFFEPRVQSSVRHRRLRYLVLFSLRTALLVLLALAFANPFVNRTSAVANRRKLNVIAIDRSFSMRYGNRIKQAKTEAQRVLNGLGGGELAQVIALDSRVESLTRPERNRGTLAATIDSITTTDETSSYGEFARAVRVIQQTSGMNVEAHLVSDMQASSMPGSSSGTKGRADAAAGFRDLQMGPHTVLKLHSVAQDSPPNWAIETVNTAGSVYDPKSTRLTATVTGWNTGPVSRQVSLLLDGKVLASKTVSLPASSRTQVEFFAFNVPYGTHRGEVRIEPHDALLNDDVFPFAVTRSDPRPVLFFVSGGRSREAYYYKAALESAADTGLTVQVTPLEKADGMDFAKFAFVVLNDIGDPGEKIALELCKYVSHGGAVLIALGPRNLQTGRVPLSSEKIAENRESQGAGFVDSQHTTFEGGGKFENVQFLAAARMTPKSNARVLARLADGSPLLTEEPMGEGRMLIFASTLDNSTNDFPLHASFLPFVAQTARYLAGAAETPTSVVSGTAVALRRTGTRGTAADVIGPDGRHELSLSEAASATSFELEQNGFYDVQRADGRRLLMAVHADRRESDLTAVAAETLDLWSHTGNTTEQRQPGGTAFESTEEQTQPSSLWKYVLVLALAVALLESIFGTRYLREERQTA